MVINCDKLMKSANLLPSVYKEIHMKYFQIQKEPRRTETEIQIFPHKYCQDTFNCLGAWHPAFYVRM